jgi:hypothetical protein
MTGRWMPATIPVPAGHSGRGRVSGPDGRRGRPARALGGSASRLLLLPCSLGVGRHRGGAVRSTATSGPLTATPTVELPMARSRNLVANPPAGAAHATGRRHDVGPGQGGRGAGAAPGGGGRPPARLPAVRSSRSPASRSPLLGAAGTVTCPTLRSGPARGHHANGEHLVEDFGGRCRPGVVWQLRPGGAGPAPPLESTAEQAQAGWAAGDGMAEPPTSSADLAAPRERDQLLATKLSIPRPRPDRLARSRLRQRLDEGLGQALILVCSPAGRGDLHHRPVDTPMTGRWMPVASWCSTVGRMRPPGRLPGR